MWRHITPLSDKEVSFFLLLVCCPVVWSSERRPYTGRSALGSYGVAGGCVGRQSDGSVDVCTRTNGVWRSCSRRHGRVAYVFEPGSTIISVDQHPHARAGTPETTKSKRAWVSLPLPFLYGLVKDDTQVHGLVWCARSLSSSVCLPVSPPARSSRAPLVWFSFRSPFFHANSRANFWLCI